jgi:hypothetical protein
MGITSHATKESVALVWLQWSTEFLGDSSNSGGESMAWKLYHRAAVVATNHTFDEPKHLDSNSFVLSMLRVAMCVSYTRVVEVIPR